MINMTENEKEKYQHQSPELPEKGKQSDSKTVFIVHL